MKFRVLSSLRAAFVVVAALVVTACGSLDGSTSPAEDEERDEPAEADPLCPSRFVRLYQGTFVPDQRIDLKTNDYERVHIYNGDVGEQCLGGNEDETVRFSFRIGDGDEWAFSGQTFDYEYSSGTVVLVQGPEMRMYPLCDGNFEIDLEVIGECLRE